MWVLISTKTVPRKVSPDLAARIAKKVPSFVPTVGVFVEQSAADIVKIAKKVGLAGVQLHGDHTVADCETIASELEVFLIKAVRVGTEADVEGLAAFKDSVGYFLLDARVDGQMGGTGQTFPWELAARAKAFKKPIFLAGDSPPKTWPRPLKQRSTVCRGRGQRRRKIARNEKISTK
jgi:phosphoribosylanthranilate isomerase